ncbi:MAG: hypothetical protein QOK05_756 [Chloroflexota bacterium]|jgi:hypothetical protein|nr:hypothetical protein [Chloroflexota bacterium]
MASPVHADNPGRRRPRPPAKEAEEIAVNVIERVMSSPATRYAWLLGFLTGSALSDLEAGEAPKASE